MSTSAETSEASTSRGAFLRARLSSFLAFAPLGVWTFVHLFHNLSAFGGATQWEEAVENHSAAGTAFTALFVIGPLLIHTVWGLQRLATSRPNNQRYGFFNNLKYLLQRASAVGVLLFLGAHLFLAFLKPRFTEGHAEPFSDITHEMRHNGPTLPVYILGTLGVAYHLAQGIAQFAISWGLATGPHGRKNAERISAIAFVVLLGMAWASLYALWAAGE